PGFDGFVGNPPFAGHVAVVASNIPGYTDWLRELHPGATGKCDVVAHFFRRAFNLLRRGGALGFIATNTVGQGDTRASGLGYTCRNGGTIYHARRRVRWPGQASVVVSVVHLTKGPYDGTPQLDGKPVGRINAFLFHRGGDDDPARL